MAIALSSLALVIADDSFSGTNDSVQIKFQDGDDFTRGVDGLSAELEVIEFQDGDDLTPTKNSGVPGISAELEVIEFQDGDDLTLR